MPSTVSDTTPSSAAPPAAVGSGAGATAARKAVGWPGRTHRLGEPEPDEQQLDELQRSGAARMRRAHSQARRRIKSW
jgi:hypothetical protein